MACVIINNKYIEYGSMLRYAYFVNEERIERSAGVRRAIESKLMLTRSLLFTDHQIIEKYNHEKNIWEVVQGSRKQHYTHKCKYYKKNNFCDLNKCRCTIAKYSDKENCLTFEVRI